MGVGIKQVSSDAAQPKKFKNKSTTTLKNRFEGAEEDTWLINQSVLVVVLSHVIISNI